MPSFTIARSALERLPVRRVEVWVDTHASAPGAKGPAEPERHAFEPGAPSGPGGGAAEPSWTPRQPDTVSGYRLRTVFEGSRPPYESPPVAVDPAQDVVEIEDLGVRIFDAHWLPFGTIETVEGSFHDLDGQPRTFRLTESSPFFSVFAGKDYEQGEPITYTLDYLLADGNFRNAGLSSSRWLIFVPNPLHEKTVTFKAVGLANGTSDATVEVVQLTYSHLEDGPGWEISGGHGDTQLYAAQPTKSLTFDAVAPEKALTVYQGTTILESGEQIAIPETLIPEATIAVGDAPLWWTVEVDPDLVDWASYRLVVVEIRAENAVVDGGDGSDQPADTLFFWEGVPPRYWSFQVPLQDSGTFTWHAFYFRENGTVEPTPERTETSHRTILPVHPPMVESEGDPP